MQEFLVVPPTVEPVTLSAAKAFLRVTHTLEDDLITGMISSARKMCEDIARVSVSPQMRMAQFVAPRYQGSEFNLLDRMVDPDRISKGCGLPHPPATAISSVTLVDQFGNRTPYPLYTFNPVTGELLWQDQRGIVFGYGCDWLNKPTTVEVLYVAGYPLWTDQNPGQSLPANQPPVIAPPNMVQAILTTLGAFYENRGDEETVIPKKALTLLRSCFAGVGFAG